MSEFHEVIENYLAVSCVLFFTGMGGVLVKKSLFAKILCLQMVVSSVHLAFASFAAESGEGSISIALNWFLLVFSFAQFFLGVGVLTAFFRSFHSLNADTGQELRQ